ncbi:MAG: Cobalamin import system permease protein BtuC [Methanomassiliicoccales archaeon PtaB.Bin215]|nr:MAG: Cobalamin import system permease protein BtuC [Methanomassiliicoccales archaeon PtaB.Bin215]
MDRKLRELVYFSLFRVCAGIVVLALLVLIGYILTGGLERLSLEFLTEMPRRANTQGGIFPAIVGTFYLMLIVMVVTVPIGIMSAIYLVEYEQSSWMGRVFKLAVYNLAGVPSIVYGLLGLGIFVVYLGFGFSLISAGLTLMQYLADSVQLSAIVSWSFGNLSNASWGWDVMIFLVFLPILLYFVMVRWDLNAIDHGDEVAKGLGVNTERFRLLGLVLTALLSAVLVSGFGVIAFVGLIAPHLARMVIGSDHRFLIPMSVVTGAGILLLANTVAINVLRPMVLPVGLLTSLLGGPMFIYLLVRRYRR